MTEQLMAVHKVIEKPKSPEEYIFDISFTVRRAELPFDTIKSMGYSGGNLDEIIRKFQTEFGQFLRNEVHGTYWR